MKSARLISLAALEISVGNGEYCLTVRWGCLLRRNRQSALALLWAVATAANLAVDWRETVNKDGPSHVAKLHGLLQMATVREVVRLQKLFQRQLCLTVCNKLAPRWPWVTTHHAGASWETLVSLPAWADGCPAGAWLGSVHCGRRFYHPEFGQGWLLCFWMKTWTTSPSPLNPKSHWRSQQWHPPIYAQEEVRASQLASAKVLTTEPMIHICG